MSNTRSWTAGVAVWLALGALTAPAGYLAQRAGLPAGWLVGPMLAALVGHPSCTRATLGVKLLAITNAASTSILRTTRGTITPSNNSLMLPTLRFEYPTLPEVLRIQIFCSTHSCG